MKKTKTKKKVADKLAKPQFKLYKIESGIKVPEAIVPFPTAQTSSLVETLKVLKPGESFIVRDPYEAMLGVKKLYDFIGRERATGGKRVFVARKVKNGTRFFRTA